MLQTQQVIHNRYQLKEKLGESAGRQTWLALDLSAHEDVVVKLLTFSDQMQWENLKLFEREAQVLKQLNHPRIPEYRNYFCVDDQLLYFGLVQEYIPGISLKQLLTQGQVFAEPEVRKIAAHILKILIYLHGLSPPVLHRDIKPSNLLLGKDSRIYLVDFGAVQDRASKEGATFTVVGTYGYAPLEQFGGRATPASDLYALGATLIHLLTGISPADLPQKDSRLQFAHLVRLNPGFVRWLEQLTQPNLERRFSSAKEALQALKANQNAIRVASPRLPESSIWLRKSPSHLQIKLSVPWHKVVTTPRNWIVVAGLGFWLFWLWMLSRGGILTYLLWLTGGLVLAAWFILPVFVATNIYFDHLQFEIEVKLLGFCIKRQRGNVSEIDKVFKSDSGGYGDKKIPEVTLAVGVEEHSFGRLQPPLSHDACRWLVDEIKHWLGL
ncbi:MAG: serine/threonine protein kinase [Iphinoe sp. HA4291-MV1]|jgi:serine/threonine protein kinase|nr:serine/threonine protein kinase [Iphinoe sp. HA4291-MV1]